MSPYLHVSAVCTFKSCKAVYVFARKHKPITPQKNITIRVLRLGKVTHSKKESKFRYASFPRRGRIARSIHKGVSNYHYQQLRKTPRVELCAGNITRSLTKDVLKMISSEVHKSTRLHNEIQKTNSDLHKFSVLHLCSAHIVKAVSQGFGKRTQDKGLKEYATYCFALLLNSTSMGEALPVFQHMCVLFASMEDGDLVKLAKNTKSISHAKHIKAENVEEDSEDQFHGEMNIRAKTVSGQSPFTRDFQAVHQKAQCQILSQLKTDKEQLFLSRNHQCSF